MHNGIDLVASSGATNSVSIVATVSGVVKRILTTVPNTHTGLGVTSNTAGNIIELETAQKYLVRYYHLQHGTFTPGLRAGSVVKVGDVLAKAGRTGRASGDHLHYEFADPKGNRFDPAPYLDNDRQFGQPETPPAEELPSPPANVVRPGLSANPKFYTVVAGDTMSGIAKRFGVSLADLARMNPQIINIDRIGIGQRLAIPPRAG